eukprot:4875799-Alexandrium_andersonii.AAC.1
MRVLLGDLQMRNLTMLGAVHELAARAVRLRWPRRMGADVGDEAMASSRTLSRARAEGAAVPCCCCC